MRVGRQKPTAVLAGSIFEVGGRGGFTAAAMRLPQLDLQLAAPPYSNGCYEHIKTPTTPTTKIRSKF
ncbi:hypothetical protein T12_3918 [Trichinella patagoniensis]|uniref:Uncharacterized protein n=1 Tax=Trichinella patagoniensis TaxID=990121 RepID=A0A0V0Z4L6_9BILA|nr:hypothetical protein T12_6355 [Trichinella patagoniensis]KRY07899.1 hypothetical protein T12_3918 [Trichinella patagoniensis]